MPERVATIGIELRRWSAIAAVAPPRIGRDVAIGEQDAGEGVDEVEAHIRGITPNSLTPVASTHAPAVTGTMGYL